MKESYCSKWKRFYRSVFFFALLMFFAAQVAHAQLEAGTYSVGEGGDYATLPDAFTAIKTDSVLGDITLELISPYTETNLVIDGVSFDSASITIRPQAEAQLTIFEGRTHITGGSQNIIFDGRPGGEGDPIADGNPVMIFRQDNNTDGNGAIHQQGAGALTVRYAQIRSDARYGIFSQFANFLTVENCEITTFQNGFTTNNNGTEYLRCLFTGGDITVRGNKMYGLAPGNTASEAVGMLFIHPNGGQWLTNAKTWTVENNSIELTKSDSTKFSVGIRLNTPNGWCAEGDVYNIRHNTVLLRGTNASSAADAISSAFYRFANAAVPEHTMEVVNNIFVNQIANADGFTASNSAVWVRADADGVVENAMFDHNNYFSGGNVGAFGNPGGTLAEYATLEDWQNSIPDTLAGRDLNTTNIEPTFTDPAAGDLSLDVPTDGSVTWFVGTPLGFEFDINGNARRQTTPTKGAYEVIIPGLPAGVYSIAADPADQGGADYASLEDAFSDIELKGLEGDVALELESGFTATGLALEGAGVPEFPVTIRPAAGSAFALFSGQTFITGGSENIVFDGRPGGTGDAFPDGNAIMIFREENNSNGNGAIHHRGAGALTVRYAEIRSDARYGILSIFANGLTVENCRLTVFQNGFATDNNGTEYIRAQFVGDDITIRNNTMYGLAPGNTASEAVGMLIIHPNAGTWRSTAKTWTIENNSIELTKSDNTKFSVGIRLNTPNGWCAEGDVYNIRHNTVLLRGSNTSTEADAISSPFYRFANAALPSHTMDVRNNIFMNMIENSGDATASHSAAWVRADADGVLENATFDYNNYYSAGNLGAVGNPADGLTTYATLADWQAVATGVDANTTNVQAYFTDIDAGDLSLLPDSIAVEDTWYIGTPIAGITADIMGSVRSDTEPTKGAYELNPGVLGLEDLIDVSSTLVAYPNPINRESVNLFMENEVRGNIRVEIVGLDGRQFRRLDFTKNGTMFSEEISLQGIPSGLFLLTITGQDHKAVKRLIKQ